MNWKPLLWKIIGIVTFATGLFAFYDYGTHLLPLFQTFVEGEPDSFEIFATLSSFFLGAGALTIVGIRLTSLRSFTRSWLLYALLPVTVWLQQVYDIDLVFSMDKILSQSVVYLCTYVFLFFITQYAHTHWFTPLSHEAMGHIGLERTSAQHPILIKILIVGIILIGLIIIHPADTMTTLRMLASPFVYIGNLF